MLTAVCCVLLSVGSLFLSLDLIRVKKQIKAMESGYAALRNEFNSLSAFSLKYIQQHE